MSRDQFLRERMVVYRSQRGSKQIFFVTEVIIENLLVNAGPPSNYVYSGAGKAQMCKFVQSGF